jgi:hypothetical protein
VARPSSRVDRTRPPATAVLDGWSPIASAARRARTEPGLQASSSAPSRLTWTCILVGAPLWHYCGSGSTPGRAGTPLGSRPVRVEGRPPHAFGPTCSGAVILPSRSTPFRWPAPTRGNSPTNPVGQSLPGRPPPSTGENSRRGLAVRFEPVTGGRSSHFPAPVHAPRDQRSQIHCGGNPLTLVEGMRRVRGQ